MRILQLRAAREWTLEKAARVFLMDLQTMQIWMRRELFFHATRFGGDSSRGLDGLIDRLDPRAKLKTSDQR